MTVRSVPVVGHCDVDSGADNTPSTVSRSAGLIKVTHGALVLDHESEILSA